MTSIFQDKPSNEIVRFVRKSFEVSDFISFLLEKKHISQKELADKLGKSESEISKWLSGTHNFTFKTIAKIEEAIGHEVTTTNSEFSEKYRPSFVTINQVNSCFVPLSQPNFIIVNPAPVKATLSPVLFNKKNVSNDKPSTYPILKVA